MNTKLQHTLVEEIEEGDVVELANGDRRLVEDIRENARMDGVWLEFADRSALFFTYNERVNLVVDA